MDLSEEPEQPGISSVSEKRDASEESSSEEIMDIEQALDCSGIAVDEVTQIELEKVTNANDLESDEYSESEGESDDEDLESEIDSMLEQGYSKSKRLEQPQAGKAVKEDEAPTRKAKSDEHNSELTIKKIVVLEEKDGNTFEVLPGGWIQVRHSSGMPLYLHRKSRVCTLSKPYYLGPGSVRRHSIPLGGIPCLSYRKALEKEHMDKELMEKQAMELENKVGDVSNEGQEVLSMFGTHIKPDAKTGTGKCPFSKSDSVAAKVNLLKRKLEIDKENSRQEKQGKLAPGDCGNVGKENEGKLLSEDSGNIIQEKGMSQETSDQDNTTLGATASSENGGNPGCTEANEGKSVPPTRKEARKLGKNAQKDQNSAGVRTLIPLAKVETARENASLYSVTPLALRDYCAPLFKFTEVECKRFKTWSARRRHTKELKRRQLERPTLPENAQVIKFFDLNASKGGDEQMVKKFNDYVFNPNGKSSVCILHEFVQHALRKQPTYSFQELENAATPYSATVMINEIPYGRGYGSSKKTAKAEAAKATLEILIPQMKGQLNGNKTDTSSDFDITEYFQQVEMNDIRIPKMCTSVSEPSPYTLLLTCLQRNFGQSGSSGIKFDMVPPSPSKGNPPNQFRMIAGNDEVTVTAANKREGKQLASQLLLAKIHPHITNFGAFIKMYGNGSIKSVKEKKQEEQQITTLQSKASANSPNWAILKKLREEMMKLTEPEENGKGGGASVISDHPNESNPPRFPLVEFAAKQDADNKTSAKKSECT